MTYFIMHTSYRQDILLINETILKIRPTISHIVEEVLYESVVL